MGGNVIVGARLEDIPIGLQVSFTKTVSESDIYLFAGISGDFDRNHVDEEYCKRVGLGGRIAHGVLILAYMSTTSTLIIQDFGRPIVSLGYEKVRFVKPVHIGDTLTILYEIIALDQPRDRTIARVVASNQHGETVAVATHIQKLLTNEPNHTVDSQRSGGGSND